MKEIPDNASLDMVVDGLDSKILTDGTHTVDTSTILKKIEAALKLASKRKQESMHRCLVEIAIHSQ